VSQKEVINKLSEIITLYVSCLMVLHSMMHDLHCMIFKIKIELNHD